MLFKDVARKYNTELRVHGKQSTPTASRVIKEMTHRWHNMCVEDIATDHINDMIVELRDRDLKPSTINTYLTYLKVLFNFANSDKCGMRFAVPSFKKLSESPKEHYLEPPQVTKLIRYLDDLRGDMAAFAFLTGLRNNNVRLLRWEHIKNETSMQFSADEMKSKKPLYLPLCRDAQMLLRKRKRWQNILTDTDPELGEIEFVFAQDNGKPFARKAVCNRTWRNAVKAAGLPKGTTFHTMRHSFATDLLKSGRDLREVMEMGHWSSLNSVQRYTHMSNDQKREVASALDGKIVF